jgi:hypothetical protein
MSTVSTPFSGPISYLPGSDAPEILVDATQLDPLLLELGVLAGLFTRDATDPTSEYRVDATWFRNPVASVRASFARADAGDQLLDLLERFLSSHAGSTIGVPQRAADCRSTSSRKRRETARSSA